MTRFLPIVPVVVLVCALGAGESDHGPDHDHHDQTALGTVTLAETEFQVVRHRQVKAGGEIGLTLRHEGDLPSGRYRAWLGIESGRGSVKTALSFDGGHVHTHLEVPDEIPEDAALWLEYHPEDGDRVKVSVPYAAERGDEGHRHEHGEPGHEHGEHGHDHNEGGHDHGHGDHEHGEGGDDNDAGDHGHRH